MSGFGGMTPAERLEHVPAIEDLSRLAKRRMPHFAWEYLDSGTGFEATIRRNRDCLDQVLFKPRGLQGEIRPELSTELFGRKYDLPFGMAPVGMTGLMWPGAELMLARSARRTNIPYCLSTVACETPEDVGRTAGENGWFQLYTFAEWAINEDLLKRAGDSGFSVLVITVDLPAPSMRERQRRAGLRVPPKITPQFIANVLARPAWALATRKRGKPAFRMLEKYLGGEDMRDLPKFLADQQVGTLYRWKNLARFRKLWKGPIVIKGLLDTEDARCAVEEGMDGIVVSNHGGRQFDGAPASISVLPEIAETVGGKTAIVFDSGVRTGLDVLRALALGADFVLAGRPYLYGAAAHGEAGADHVSHILATDLANNMVQLGVSRLSQLRGLAVA